jgi:hypothetical protein
VAEKSAVNKGTFFEVSAFEHRAKWTTAAGNTTFSANIFDVGYLLSNNAGFLLEQKNATSIDKFDTFDWDFISFST